jgi:HEPN domain-containing protein
VNRAHWQALAEQRILAAQALLAAQQWSSAYYLAGYAVEFGLKSCILVHVETTGVIFKERKFSEQCWSHDVEDLLALAGLKDALKVDMAANPALDNNWTIVTEWDEMSRYEQKTQADAEKLYEAITDNANGVMSWIRVRC